MDDDANHYKILNAQAYRYQRFMRIWSIAAFLYPVLVLICLIYDLMPGSVMVSALGAAIFVYAMNHQKYGEIHKWWWFRRGKLVSLKSFERIEEARQWLKENHWDFYEIQPGTFKFFNLGQAVQFKLIWA